MNTMKTTSRFFLHHFNKGIHVNAVTTNANTINLNSLKPMSSSMMYTQLLHFHTNTNAKSNYDNVRNIQQQQQKQKQQKRGIHILCNKSTLNLLSSSSTKRPFNLFPKRGITTEADQHFILTATGPDRVGIVSDIAKIILDNQGDIAESRMVRMGGDFTAMMRACATKPQVQTITDKLYTLQSVHCLVHYISNRDFQIDTNPVWEASVTLQGANHPGIVFGLTDLLKKYGIRVQDMHTDTELAPFGGTELFLLDAHVVSDSKFDVENFYREIDQIQDQLSIDIDIEEMDRFNDHEEEAESKNTFSYKKVPSVSESKPSLA